MRRAASNARTRAAVEETSPLWRGPLHGTTVAEVSPDPITATSWALMPGAGKQRKLSGYASGTRLWVRFAAVKYGQQSAWSTPVMLTMR